ncbi:MAG TPA: LuxR family transcriptional regulator [Ideonella sp.]|uniref:LuxR family transcriptional regulator n=1 Tax=Ideonella sp. TaxID=1929293 RepID=UPI002BB7D828|nr:LuxR family transcriptional regulator [Ideonella sp.]HSI50341.1 LuxR family transcriptional regulator [Ideonella sp.]
MTCWQLEQLRVVSAAVSPTDTFAAVVAEANRLGFQYASFGLKSPVPIVAPRVAWCSNYPPDWEQLYNKRGYIRRDPTVAHAITSDESVCWSDALFAACPELLENARSFGLNHGWAQPRRDARGMVSLLTLCRSDPPIESAELEQKADRMQWLSHVCHEGMCRIWGHVLQDSVDGSLSARELDVLRWSCEGKTALDIAQIIGIAEATVNYHARSACAKLGAGNRTAAAVRAAVMGLLW